MKQHEMNGFLIDLCKDLGMRVNVSNDNLLSAQAPDGRTLKVFHTLPGEWRAEIYRGKTIRHLHHTYVGTYTYKGVRRLGLRVVDHLGKWVNRAQ